MSAHEEREAILARVIAGDLRDDESPARELLEGSEDARQELAELRALELTLGDSHAERDEILSETRGQTDTSDENELWTPSAPSHTPCPRSHGTMQAPRTAARNRSGRSS